MKHFIILLCLGFSTPALSQAGYATILEQRAKDLHLVISKSNREAWREFINDNFTPALIERPMRAQVSTSENDGVTKTKSTTETRMDEKLNMFQRLHTDFGKSSITSIAVTGKTVKMILTAGPVTGIFLLDCEPESPWLIDKMGIEVEAGN